MVTDRLLWLLPIFIWSCLSKTSTAQHGRTELLSAAMVVGTVYCDTCFHQSFSKNSNFIAGAYVGVEFRGARAVVPRFRKEVKTDQNGKFKVVLPFRVEKHVTRIKGCKVKLLNSSEPHCSAPSIATSSYLHLKSRKQRTHIFSAGFFTFKPLKVSKLCFKDPSSKTHFTLSFADQKMTGALVDNGEKAKTEAVEEQSDTLWPQLLPFMPPPPSILPPNPLVPQPPPFYNFPPIPIFPSPPPPPFIKFPPVPFQPTPPPPPPLFNFPPIPFFAPPPPPPPPPPFFSFPPIPFFAPPPPPPPPPPPSPPPPLVPYVPFPPFPFPPLPPPPSRQNGQLP